MSEGQREESMPLTNEERRALAQWRSLHHAGQPTVLGAVGVNRANWLFLAVITGAGWYLGADAWLVGLAGGYVLATVVKDLRAAATQCRLWRVSDQIIDWDRVDALLDRPNGGGILR